MLEKTVVKSLTTISVTIKGELSDFNADFGSELYDILCNAIEPVNQTAYEFKLVLPAFFKSEYCRIDINTHIDKFISNYAKNIKKFDSVYKFKWNKD